MIHAVSLFHVDSEAAGQFNLAAMTKHSLFMVDSETGDIALL